MELLDVILEKSLEDLFEEFLEGIPQEIIGGITRTYPDMMSQRIAGEILDEKYEEIF